MREIKTRKLENLQNDSKTIFWLIPISFLCGTIVFGFAVYMGYEVYRAMHMAALAFLLPLIPLLLCFIKGFGVFTNWKANVAVSMFSALCIITDFSANFMGVVHHYETDQKQLEVAQLDSESVKNANSAKLANLEKEKQERVESVNARYAPLKASLQARIDEESRAKAQAEKNATDQEFGRNGVKQGLGPGYKAAKADALSADTRKKEAEGRMETLVGQEQSELDEIQKDISTKIASLTLQIEASNSSAAKSILEKEQSLNPIELFMRNHVADGWVVKVPNSNKEVTLTKEAMLNTFFLCVMVFLSFGPPLIFELVVAPLIKKYIDLRYEIKSIERELEQEDLEEIQKIETEQAHLGVLADEIETLHARNAILAEKLNMAQVLHWTPADRMRDAHRLAKGTRDQVMEYLESYECEFDVPKNYDKLDRETRRNLMMSLVSAVVNQCAKKQKQEVFEMV